MSESTEPLDIEEELEVTIESVESSLKDSVKRGFTNVVMQRSREYGDKETPISLSDVFFIDNDGNQISLLNLKAYGCSSFHLLNLDLSLAGMRIAVSAGVGSATEADGALLVEAVYKATCPALQTLLPITADGRLRVVFSGVKVIGTAGLEIKDDSLYILNTDLNITLDEVLLNVSYNVPKTNSLGEEYQTSEISQNSIEKLPLVEKFAGELFYQVQQSLTSQLNSVLLKTTSISEIMGGNHQLVEAFSTRVASASSTGNMVVDMILMEVRKNFLQKCIEVVQLPDLHASFSRRIGLVTVHGEFETNDGWLSDLSTIDRTNDVTLTMGVSKASFVVAMGLSRMRIGFDEYRLKFMNIGPTGRVEAIIGKNSIHMKISAGVNKWMPYAEIDEIKIEYFGDVDVHITGLGPLNYLVSSISTWVSGHIKNIAIPLMEKQIRAEIQRAIDSMDIWKLITQANT